MFQFEIVVIALGVSLGMTVALGSVNICPPHWKTWALGSCYQLNTKPATWGNAREACLHMGGKMAAPRSLQENEIFARMAAKEGIDRMWVACSDREVEGRWECEGGAQGGAFLHWEPGEPNNYSGAEDCVAMRVQDPRLVHGWVDISCDENFPPTKKF